MARVPMIDPGATTDATVVRVYAEIERELGFGIVPNVFRAMASRPAILAAQWALFRAVVLEGVLPRVLKEMVGVVVSTTHRSEYVRQVHLHSLGVQGVGEAALRALAAGATEAQGLSATTVAALGFAQRAARGPGAVTDRDVTALQDAGLSPAEVTELITTIELFTAINLFTDVSAVAIDQV